MAPPASIASLGALVRNTLGSFRPSTVPRMSRESYRWELLGAGFFPMLIPCVEAGVLGVIAQKVYHADAWVVATIAAVPVMANLTSIVWARALRGRDRVRFVNALQLTAVLCVLGIALLPSNNAGLALLVLGMALTRCCLTGIISGRADVWRENYARGVRARVVGKLTTVATLAASATGAAIALSMRGFHGPADAADLPAGVSPHRWVFMGAALLALIGVWSYSHVRWRRRAAAVRVERAADAQRTGLAHGARQMLDVLRKDRDYRRFMAAQFILGVPNLAAGPVFLVALDERTGLGAGESILLAQIIPFLIPVAAIPLWARMLDRMHVVRFRTYHAWTFVLSNGLLAVGFLIGSVPVLYLARVALGLGHAGAMLAWDIGHHDFAKRDLATIYMGVHITLTGVRGAFAPFLGAALYTGFSLSAMGLDLSVPGLGAWTFALLAAGSLFAVYVFVWLDRSMNTRAKPVQDA